MLTKTIDAIYEHGILRPRNRLPFREHAHLRLTIIRVSKNPVSRTAGIIRVSPRTAREIISGGAKADPISRTSGMFHVPERLAKTLIYDETLLDL